MHINKLNQYNFIITGSNGWIGRYLIETLAKNSEKPENCIFAISKSSNHVELRDGTKIRTIKSISEIPKDRKYILCHFSFLTKDKESQMPYEEYCEANLAIRIEVGEIIKNLNIEKMIYASSGSVYNEDDDNYYGKLKLEDEKYFLNLMSEAKGEIIIPRIFNIAAPYINKVNLYALSDFIIQAINNSRIDIKATIPVLRSYIHLSDLFEICFSWLLDDNKSEICKIFDTAGESILEMSELAKEISKIIGNCQIRREIFNATANPNYYIGNSATQKELCKKYDIKLKNIDFLIQDTAEYIKNHIIQK